MRQTLVSLILLCPILFLSACTSPEIEKRQRISWPEAVELIRAGKVTFVFQAHSLRVFLRTYDGVSYETVEPEIDDVLKLIKVVDPSGKKILYLTE